LTGEQGVIIPYSNVQNLMLRRDVVDAVRKKQFHVYRVSTVEEGIEIITGVKAGRPDPNGLYPPGTVFGEVQKKLKIYIERARRLKREAGAGED
jgi:predicted ATP-dependent protease